MPNTISITWVKNVYSLGIRSGERCGLLPTPLTLHHTVVTTPGVQLLFIPQVFSTFTLQLYTYISALFTLVKTYLYTVSTAPTITKTKEKKGNK